MSTNLVPLITKGIDRHYFAEYKSQPAKYARLFHVEDMKGRYYDDQTWRGYRNPRVTLPLRPVAQDSIAPSFSMRYWATKYTLGDLFAFEDVADDPYGLLHRLVPGRAGMMARSYATNRERLAADFFATAAWSTASPAPGSPDGVSLFNTSHPIALDDSTTWSNTPSTHVDLSHSAYNTAYANLVQQMANNNYEIIDNEPAILVVNPTQRAVAKQLVGGTWERGSSNLNENVAREDGLELMLWAYFRLTGASSAAGTWNGWFIQGKTHYLNWFNRESFKSYSDTDTTVFAYLVTTYERFGFGYTDPRGMYGSKGA